MASIRTFDALCVHACLPSPPPRLVQIREQEIYPRFPGLERVRVFGLRGNSKGREKLYCCICKASTEIENVCLAVDEKDRPPFDINLAVVLAGFAFEAYSTPPDNIGRRELDAAGCKTVFLSESFVREIYDGQVFVKLKEGLDLPAMDPWGTSDPYVVIELDGQVVKSSTKWGNKEPKWNEDFTLYTKQPPKGNLQLAAWDANLVTPPKRMGNAGLNLESLCDGETHELVVELEGMGGGGKLKLEVKYKTFDQIEEEKQWWRLPFVSKFLRKNGLEHAMNMISGSETVQARQFVKYAFGQLKSFNDEYLGNEWSSNISNNGKKMVEKFNKGGLSSEKPQEIEGSSDGLLDDIGYDNGSKLEEVNADNSSGNGKSNEVISEVTHTSKSDKYFWKEFANAINQSVVEKLGLPTPEKLKWDGFDLLNKVGLQSKKIAEASYIETGLAIPQHPDEECEKTNASFDINIISSSFPDIKKATQDLLKQTDSVLGALMVLNAAISESNKETPLPGKTKKKREDASIVGNNGDGYLTNEQIALRGELALDEKKLDEMKELFKSAESAMEAWAMLATSLGHSSFIKSEFEKICFLDNESTDTQVAIWRDTVRKRLVVSFRGTEQTKWKDLVTDLMIIPAGLNPERIGGDFKEELQVHTGFVSAYDSVKIRITSLIKQAICYNDDNGDPPVKWHVFVTGHSLGGALATLLALELSSSQLAKRGAMSVTMYNFGSPRVGNKRFAEVYNQKVKDSWRVVNHRDIIPTVPRLMGYCHVAQPLYLAARGDVKLALENLELSGDGYQGDVIGESTPDVLVNEFMKGEKELVEKILQTEINIFRAIRDGSALMQHMEDFYYITLLEHVKSNYSATAVRSESEDKNNGTIGQG